MLVKMKTCQPGLQLLELRLRTLLWEGKYQIWLVLTQMMTLGLYTDCIHAHTHDHITAPFPFAHKTPELAGSYDKVPVKGIGDKFHFTVIRWETWEYVIVKILCSADLLIYFLSNCILNEPWLKKQNQTQNLFQWPTKYYSSVSQCCSFPANHFHMPGL